jgi:hypothetical protein
LDLTIDWYRERLRADKDAAALVGQ